MNPYWLATALYTVGAISHLRAAQKAAPLRVVRGPVLLLYVLGWPIAELVFLFLDTMLTFRNKKQ